MSTGAGAGWRLRVARAEDAGEVLVLTRAAFLAVGQHVGDLHLPPLAEPLAAAAGAARVELFTGHGQVGALALYRGRGYQDVEPPTRGPGAGLEHLVHLARPLAPDGAGAAVQRTT